MRAFASFLRRDGAHLLLLLIGAGLFIGGCFQNSQWFDEAYTVGLMHHSLPDTIRWTTFDVHPHLYYILLKLFTLLFGASLPVMRLFSALGGILFASLGYTHLRRDFGKAVGFWFSFCVIFCSQTLAYSLAIRMYTWAAFFLALAAIYAYRMATDPDTRRNRVLFLVFALCAAYTHYFGLFAAGMIQLFLLLRTRKRGESYRFWLVNSAILVGAYLPGIVVFLLQIAKKGASWIQIEWPDLVFDLTSYPLLGDVLKVFVAREGIDGYISIPYLIAGGAFLALYALTGYLLFRQMRKNRVEEKQSGAIRAALFCYFGVVLFTLTVSLFRPLWYPRYSVVFSGLLFFVLACLLASARSKLPKLLAAALLLCVCGRQIYYYYDLFYDPSADAVVEALDPRYAPSTNAVEEDRVLPGDVFLFDGPDTFNVTVWFPENDTIYFNNGHWGIQNTYRAFGPKVRIVDALEETEGLLGERVWTDGRGLCYQYLCAIGYAEDAVHPIHLTYYDRGYQMILMVRTPE
ncbi:MAG: glycosyltransferase family 39 protein [Oscillospiraceae bacterium]|nr:glycosyltransferase family 39 protein [Oscillospiraceae bacterium]